MRIVNASSVGNLNKISAQVVNCPPVTNEVNDDPEDVVGEKQCTPQC